MFYTINVLCIMFICEIEFWRNMPLFSFNFIFGFTQTFKRLFLKNRYLYLKEISICRRRHLLVLTLSATFWPVSFLRSCVNFQKKWKNSFFVQFLTISDKCILLHFSEKDIESKRTFHIMIPTFYLQITIVILRYKLCYLR